MIYNICRVCLCGDRRMYALNNTALQEMWEKLTNAEFNTNDGRPCLVCYICCAQLRKCSQLRQRALKAEELLTAFINNGLKQSQDTILLIACLSNDLNPMCVNKEVFHFEYKQFQGNILEEIKKDNEEESEEHEQKENDINVKEEEDSSDSHQEDNIDFADVERVTLSGDDAPLTSKIKKDILQKEVRIILEKIDIAAPVKERKSKEVPQKTKPIKLDETAKDKEILTNPGLESLPNNNCKASEINLSRDLPVDSPVEISKGIQASTSTVNCYQVNNISPKFYILQNDNIQFNNIFVQNNDILYYTVCSGNAENQPIIQYPPKSTDAVAPGTSTERSCEGNKSNVKEGLEYIFKCHICQYKSFTERDLNIHLNGHIGEKPFMCDLCNYRCARNCDLKRHVKYKHSMDKKFQCDICQYRFVERAYLKKHLRTHTGEKPYMCDSCNYKCAVKYDLQRHVQCKHLEKKYSCHICEYKCAIKATLNIHLCKHTGEKPYICDFCGYRTAKKVNLNLHLESKHIKELKYSCHLCQYKCVIKRDLNIHLHNHTIENPYICDLCGYRCPKEFSLIKHMKNKHSLVKDFTCHVCQYKCDQKSILNKHLRKHSGEKPYVCDYCGYRSLNKGDLDKHIGRRHVQNNKHSCHLCQYKCGMKCDLKRHLRSHTGKNQYICDLCDYRCPRKCDLKKHMNNKHV